MIKMIVPCMVLLVVIKVVVCQKPSPCPDVFTYEPRGSEPDRWYGVISLHTPEDLTGVWLHVNLDQTAELLGNWFGEASSSDNMEFVIRNSKYKLEAGPPVSIRFFVKYNQARTIPSVTKILLNGKTICTTQKTDLKPTMPTLHISQVRTTTEGYNNQGGGGRPNSNEGNTHRPGSGASRPTSSNSNSNRPGNGGSINRNPEENRPLSNSGGNRGHTSSNNGPNNNNERNPGEGNRPPSNSGGNRGQPSSNNRPNTNNNERPNTNSNSGDFAVNRPTQNRPSNRPSQETRNPGCGTIASRASPLISNGQDTAPGQWPWHAALYHSKGIQLMYTCGATLITQEHVLTAAHCVTKPHTNRPVSPSNILIYLGKYDLITFGPEVKDRAVSKIFVHPDYNYTIYFNDIAVLKLSQPVEITNFVRPCCLWEGESELEDIINKQGTVVGWGFDENRKLSSKLMQAQMPIVSTITCIYSNRDFFSQFTFEKNFCAGFRNGTSVCNGDSGGGMVFPKKGTSGQNTVWQIRGIVSVGVALQGQGICDTSQYIVFTDVAKYTHWIRQVVAQ